MGSSRSGRGDEEFEDSQVGEIGDLLLREADLGIWTLHVPSGAFSSGRRWAEMLGYRAGALAPNLRTWKGLVHPEDLPGLEEDLRACLEGPRPGLERECRMRTASGAWRWIRIRGRIRDRASDGAPLRMIGIQRDVHERRLGAEAGAVREARLRAILEALPDAVLVLDREGRYRDVLSWDESLLIRPSREILGQSLRAFFPPDTAAFLLRNLARTLETGRVHSVEYEADLPMGRRRFEARIAPLPLPGGPTAVLLLARDTTERWAAERRAAELEREAARSALAEERERLDVALRGAGLGMWDWEIPTGRVIRNERWAEMLGYRLEEIPQTHETWIGRIHPEDRERVVGSLEAHLRGETPFHSEEYRIRHASGEWVWVLDSGRVIARDESGRPLRAAGVHQDITARKELQAREAEAVRREREWIDLRGRFVDMVSHELRTPLAVARLTLDTLDRHGEAMTPERRRRHRQIARQALEEMEALIEGVLALSREEATRGEGNRLVPLDPTVLLAERAERIRALDGTHRVELSVSPSARGPFLLDPERLRTALDNLLSNAVKYSPGADRVEIRAERLLGPGPSLPEGAGAIAGPEEWLSIEIRDFGIGVPPEDRPRLFEPFHRGRNVGTIRGTGLGLALVRLCAERMGGGLTYRDAPGGGTVFRLLLPVRRPGPEGREKD